MSRAGRFVIAALVVVARVVVITPPAAAQSAPASQPVTESAPAGGGSHASTAQESAPARGDARASTALRVWLPVDLSVTAGAATAWLVSDLLKSQLAPLACRWCESNALDTAVRDHLRWSNGGAAVTLSNVGAFAMAPLVGAGLLAVEAGEQGGVRQVGVDLLVTAEAVALAGALDQLVKYSVGRQRPYAHAGVPNPDTGQGADDANLSFYSAHTSIAFSIAAAAGTVAYLRRYRWAPAIYIAGAAVGAATAYLRIAADQHYLTDVVTGAVVGSAVGVGVPWLHRADAPLKAIALVPTGGGLALAVVW